MIMWIIVIVSAIWVYIDAKNIGIKKGVTPEMSGWLDMGPAGWSALTLLLWLLGFPLYLYHRGTYKKSITLANSPVESKIFSESGQFRGAGLEDLERLASLKEKGHVTAAEFEEKKRKLLGL